MRYFIVAWGLMILAGCEDRGGSLPSPAPSKAARQKSEAGKWQQDLLQYGLNNLERVEEFHSEGMMEQILKRGGKLQQLEETKKLDPLVAAWPEPQMLRQIVDRLNHWIHGQTPPAEAAVDPAVAALPEAIRRLPLMQQLEKLQFVPFDGFALQEAVLLRDAAQAVRGETLDDLTRAKNLFDWVIRNFQLDPESENAVLQFPWEVMLFGRGTVWERAWVFILLARQQGLDAAVLAVQTQPGNKLQTAERDSPMVADHASMVPEKSGPSAGGPSPSLRPWCVGVLIGGEVYLFDPLEGVPIPGPNGVQFDAQGKLDLTPATLEQAKSDPAILKGMDASPSNPYPLQAADLKAVTAWIEASPEYLALRMKLLEPHFLGKQKLVLSVSPSAELKRWKEAAGVADAQLWLYPYVTLRQRARLPVPLILRQLVSFLPFYAIPEVPVSKERVVQVPLYKGRILHLKGRLAGEPGAMQYYQLSRFSPEEMNNWMEEKVQMLVKEGMKEQKDLDEAEASRREAQLRERAELLMQGHLGLILQGKQDATYWLGLVAYQRGNYKAAIDYLSTRTLEVWPEGPWAHGAKYNFARSAEALGDLDRAILLYQSDPTAPDAPGRLLRAKWLQTKGVNHNRNPAGG